MWGRWFEGLSSGDLHEKKFNPSKLLNFEDREKVWELSLSEMLQMLLALMVRLINPPLAPANVPLHTDVVYCATLTLFLLVCFVLPSSKNKCL